jgi:KUP system potassium uptake protein
VTQLAEKFGALPETVIALTVAFQDTPRVVPELRLELQEVSEGFWDMTARYGFVEVPNLPAALHGAKLKGCPIDLDKAVYFGARDRVIGDRKNRHLRRWQLPLFSFMYRNAVRAVDLFDLPPKNFVEISRQIEL